MDRVVLYAENDQQRYEAGRCVADPFGDQEAGSIGFIEDRDECLCFGAGEQERVSKHQRNHNDLCEITIYEGREHIAGDDVQKEVEHAGNLAIRQDRGTDPDRKKAFAQKQCDNSKQRAVQEKTRDQPNPAFAAHGNTSDSAHCRKDRQKQNGSRDRVEDTDKGILKRHQNCGGDHGQDVGGKDQIHCNTENSTHQSEQQQSDTRIGFGTPK